MGDYPAVVSVRSTDRHICACLIPFLGFRYGERSLEDPRPWWDQFIRPLWLRFPRSKLGDVLVLSQPIYELRVTRSGTVMQQPFGLWNLFDVRATEKGVG